jgi:predicted nucleic acid-binding protein
MQAAIRHPVSEAHVLLALDLSQRYGLLSNAALILAVMEREGLSLLASNDADFDRVPTITRITPN